MLRVDRFFVFVWLLMAAVVVGAAGQAQAAYDKRFDVAENYLRYFGDGKYREAYSMLATDESFDDFMKRIELVNKHFEQEMREKGYDVVTKKILAVSPMTFEDNYIIVSVRTEIVARKGAQEVSDVMPSDVYFRFNKEGQIEMVHGIGDGWLC